MNKNWEKTEKTHKVWVNGKINEYPIWNIPINDLYLYPNNTRFIVNSIDNGIYGKDFKNPEIQAKLKEYISNTFMKENEKTKLSILENGLMDPIFIDKNGLVLSGNRRTTILKEINEEFSNKFKFVRSLVIEEELDEFEKQIFELSLQYEPDPKVKYSRFNKMHTTHQIYTKYKNENLDMSDLWKKIGYTNFEKFNKDIIEYELLKEYLEFHNENSALKLQYSELNGNKYLNIIDTLNNLLNKNEIDEVEKKKIKIGIFNLMYLDGQKSLDIRSVFNAAYGKNSDYQNNYIYKSLHNLINEIVVKTVNSLKTGELSKKDKIYKTRQNDVKKNIVSISNELFENKSNKNIIEELIFKMSDFKNKLSELKKETLDYKQTEKLLKINSDLKEIQKIIKNLSK